MTYIERRGRVWGLIAEQAAARGGRVSAADVCAAVVPEVQVTGAWLSAALDARTLAEPTPEELALRAIRAQLEPVRDQAAASDPATRRRFGVLPEARV